MTFALPNTLWLLLLVPALVAFLWWTWRTKERLIAQFVQSRLLAQLTVGVSKQRQKLRLGLLVASVALAILALARPQWGFSWEEAKQRGLDIVVAIDVSRSMLATDVTPNRLARAKLAALDLMKLAKNDRLGLVAFAGSAFLQCPLTLDDEAFRQCVAALDVNIIPQGGTALAETISTALTAFKDEGDNHKVLIILTDGEDHDGGAVEAARKAAKDGLRVFTIGLGSAEGELIQVPGAKGQTDFLRDADGNIVKSRLNETLLRQISGAANGFYLHFRGPDTIEMLYRRGLEPLPKSEFGAKLLRRYHERFYWPLGLAIVFLVVEMFLPERKKVTGSQAIAAASSNEALRQAVVALALLLTAAVANASPASALQAYREGRFEAAAKEWQRLAEDRPEDARLHYNAGAAAFQAKKYDEAERRFSAAIAATDPKLQQSGYYNLGNTFFRGGERTEETEKKMEAWERALQLYEQALKREPQDQDAKFNQDFVKLKLEELKKQQQEQQKQQSKDGKPDDKDKQDKPDKKPDDQKDKPPQSKPDNGKKDKQGQQPDSKPDDQKQGKEEQPKPDKNGGEQKQDKDKSGERGEPQPASAQPALGQMTMQQAMQLLDSQKGEERALIFTPAEKAQSKNRIFKDW